MPIAFESPDQPEVVALIADLDAYQDTLYPPESRHALDLASLKLSNVLFAVARDADGHAIGCGAIVLYPEFGELKRMHVSPRGRGQGVAKKLMAVLESRATDFGCTLLKLETGPYQHEVQVTEDRLGFLLFECSRGRLHPTPEAKRIFQEVEVAYEGVQRVDDLVQALIEGRSGKLNIVCSPRLGVHLVPRAIARFNRQYPELPIHFEPLTYNNLISRVLLGESYLGGDVRGSASPT